MKDICQSWIFLCHSGSPALEECPQLQIRQTPDAKRRYDPDATHDNRRRHMPSRPGHPVGEWQPCLPLVVVQRDEVDRRGHQLRHDGDCQLRDGRLGVRGHHHGVWDGRRHPARKREGAEDGHGISEEESRRRGPGKAPGCRRRRHRLARLERCPGTKDLGEAQVFPYAEGNVDEQGGGEGGGAHGNGAVVSLGHGRRGVGGDVGCRVQGPDDAERPGEEETAGSTDGGA